MKDLTDYFQRIDNIVSPPNTEIERGVSKKEGKKTPTTPKSRKRNISKRTPRGKNKVSPKTSPLEGFNLLFNVAKRRSPEIKPIDTTMEIESPTEMRESNSQNGEHFEETQDASACNSDQNSKANAFQILMMSRHKVIGSNSPGKELQEPEDKPGVSPSKLLARKRQLKTWSDSIKAKKRKLNDDEIDKCIKIKLNTRKERLKTLLHIDGNNSNTQESKRSRKKSDEKNPSTSENIREKINKNLKDLTKENPVKNKSLSSGDDFEVKMDNIELSTPKSSKSRRHKKSSHNTPKSSKWKMKIKLFNQDSDDNCSDQKIDYETILNENENYVNKLPESKIESQSIDVKCVDSRITDGEIEICEESVISKETESDIPKNKEKNDEIHITEAKDVPGIDEIIEKNTIIENGVAVQKTEEANSEIVLIQEVEKTDEDILIIDESDEKITVTEDPDVEIIKTEESNENRRVLRNRISLNKNKNIDYAYSSDESDEDCKKKRRKTVKVAPVFAKAIPKPKIDPEVLEARRKFLMSDMPDVLRKKIEKQANNAMIEDIVFDVFPKVSHINQSDPNNPLWNLPNPDLKITNSTPLLYELNELFCQSLTDKNEIEHSRYDESKPIKCTKTIEKNMKLENEKYPVHKAFRLLSEKNGLRPVKSKTTPRRGRKPKNSLEKVENKSDSQNGPMYQMWTEKYKPRSSEDFFDNSHSVSNLKKWLEKWKDVLESGKKKKKKFSSDSESDFMSSDAESIYDRSLATTVVLSGPCGSGKSSSVYAIANELGLNVLELNASSRRTGKHILQELQEATQSHQVRKNKGVLDAFANKKSSKPAEDKETNKSRRMCVLLIEDIDIVFEQDDGFISAISQITSTSKRPIVLTTTNENSAFAQKFTNEFKTIKFHPMSVKNLGLWLQILCLLEGIFVDLSSIGELLEYNRGDIRKTLLELQYWIQTGGQINKSKTLLDSFFKIDGLKYEINSCPTIDDTPSNHLEYDEKFEDYRVHSNILSDFEIFQLDKFLNIPCRINLKTLWWNIPKFLEPSKQKPGTKKPKSQRRIKQRLKMVSDMYDSISVFDVSYRKTGFKMDDPVCRKSWHCRLQDSLELEERSGGSCISDDFLELNHYLTDSHLNRCKKKFIYEFSENQRFLDMALPRLDEERELDNNHNYEEELLEPVPYINNLDRKSVVLDYLPCIRQIARTEKMRSENNVKRHNRFHHYLRDLNITCDTPILDFAVHTFETKKC